MRWNAETKTKMRAIARAALIAKGIIPHWTKIQRWTVTVTVILRDGTEIEAAIAEVWA